MITSAVGRGRPNRPADVLIVQQLLVRHRAWLWPLWPPAETGQYEPTTDAAILRFQETAAAMKSPDGVIAPGSFVMRQLERDRIPKPQHAIFAPACWYHPATGLTSADYDAAAARLTCPRSAIQAVAQTETMRSAWEGLGRPTILFERHYFSRLTKGRFNHSHPDLSNPSAGGYGKYAEQFPKLGRAAVLDEAAALQAASWGTFQIMGANYQAAGFASVADFVDAMMESERRHLDAFVAFILSSPAMAKALRTLDWTAFARHYNGSNYKKNAYDSKMAAAYASLAPAPAPSGAPQAPRR